MKSNTCEIAKLHTVMRRGIINQLHDSPPPAPFYAAVMHNCCNATYANYAAELECARAVKVSVWVYSTLYKFPQLSLALIYSSFRTVLDVSETYLRHSCDD